MITKYSMGYDLGLRIALVSDLHNTDGSQVVEKIKSIRPDIILVVGDTLERHEEGKSKWTNEAMEQW